MEFQFWPAVIAGFVGGLTMSMAILMMRKAGKTEMDMALIQGAMLSGDRDKAKGIGAFTHLVVFSGLLIGSAYAALFAAFDTDRGDAWWVGALIGVVHGLMAGVMMGVLHKMHPRMADTADVPTGTPGGANDGALLLKPPGVFAKNYGSATPPGVLMVHVLYGLVVGLVYSALV